MISTPASAILLVATLCSSNWIATSSSCPQLHHHLQALTVDQTGLYLIESDHLWTIPWSAFDVASEQLHLDSRHQGFWYSVPWITKVLPKFKTLNNQLFPPPRLLHFQILPSTNGPTLFHLVIRNTTKQPEELFWYTDSTVGATFYYTAQHNLPRHFHTVCDSTGSRRYIFTRASELLRRSPKKKSKEVVLLPIRSRDTEYWFSLKVNRQRTKVIYALQGDPSLVPPKRGSRGSNLLPEDGKLPFGFIHQSSVYLFTSTNQVAIFKYQDISDPLVVLDFTKRRRFRTTVRLKNLKNFTDFFQCIPEVETTTKSTASHLMESSQSLTILILLLFLLYLVGVAAVSYICTSPPRRDCPTTSQ